MSSIVPAATLTAQPSTVAPGTSLTVMPVRFWNSLKVAVNLASSSLDRPCERLTVVPLYWPFMALAISGPIADQSMLSQLTAGPPLVDPPVVAVAPPVAAVVSVGAATAAVVLVGAAAAVVSVGAATAAVVFVGAAAGGLVGAGALVGVASVPQAVETKAIRIRSTVAQW